jgi:hypothetical protein
MIYRRDINPQAEHHVSHMKLMDASDGTASQNNIITLVIFMIAVEIRPRRRRHLILRHQSTCPVVPQ